MAGNPKPAFSSTGGIISERKPGAVANRGLDQSMDLHVLA